MDQNLMNLDEAMKESLEKIFQLLDEKKYFLAKDELLKYNDADIAEMFEELLDKPELIEQTVVVYRLLPKDVSVEVFSSAISVRYLMRVSSSLSSRSMTAEPQAANLPRSPMPPPIMARADSPR